MIDENKIHSEKSKIIFDPLQYFSKKILICPKKSVWKKNNPLHLAKIFLKKIARVQFFEIGSGTNANKISFSSPVPFSIIIIVVYIFVNPPVTATTGHFVILLHKIFVNLNQSDEQESNVCEVRTNHKSHMYKHGKYFCGFNLNWLLFFFVCLCLSLILISTKKLY